MLLSMASIMVAACHQLPRLFPLFTCLIVVVLDATSCEAVGAASASPSIDPKQAPNFVVVYFDDFGYGDWSLTGSPAITPNLETMLHSPHSLLFDRFYSGAPICSPSRAGLHTGRTPSRTCIYSVEQHILSRLEFSVANATKLSNAGYTNFFAGKWHLGSIEAPDRQTCYVPAPSATTCDPGYVLCGSQCCFGVDGHLDISMPLNFGYDHMMATPQCGPSATTNCGCFNHTSIGVTGHEDTAAAADTAHTSSPCIVGHYSDACPTCSYALECTQYFKGSTANNGEDASIAPLDFVSSDDDQEFIVDNFAEFARNATNNGSPFLAVLCFHGVHIPYVATEKYRDLYAGRNYTSNELDYYGVISSMDAAVGRIRTILKDLQVDNNTMILISSDNGPEVSPASGQGTGKQFPNPGRTDGLKGRKRDLTEGGIRTIGIVEFPALINTGSSDVTNISTYPASVLDMLPTVMDLLNVSHPRDWPIDGSSLVPIMKEPTLATTTKTAIPKRQGFYGVFGYGTTNHNNGSPNPGCPLDFNKTHIPQITSGFSTPGNQPQAAYMRDNLKLFGCRDKHNSEAWHFFLFDINKDRYETTDLYYENDTLTKEITAEFYEWQQSVFTSQGPQENDCNPNPPGPPPIYHEIPSMHNSSKRCSAADSNDLGQVGAPTVDECASNCAMKEENVGCAYFSYSPTCKCCWLFRDCNSIDSSSTWKYKDWSTYEIGK